MFWELPGFFGEELALCRPVKHAGYSAAFTWSHPWPELWHWWLRALSYSTTFPSSIQFTSIIYSKVCSVIFFPFENVNNFSRSQIHLQVPSRCSKLHFGCLMGPFSNTRWVPCLHCICRSTGPSWCQGVQHAISLQLAIPLQHHHLVAASPSRCSIPIPLQHHHLMTALLSYCSCNLIPASNLIAALLSQSETCRGWTRHLYLFFRSWPFFWSLQDVFFHNCEDDSEEILWGAIYSSKVKVKALITRSEIILRINHRN